MSEIHPACALCQGACCRTIGIPIDMSQLELGDKEHFGLRKMRIYIEPEVVVLDCACSALTTEGACGRYETRPQPCINFPLGGEECRLAVQDGHLPWDRDAIYALLSEAS